MNKFFTHVFSFSLAFLTVLTLGYVFKNNILNFYAKPLKDSLQKTIGLQNDLESGKIVLFGSSELVMYHNQKYLPQNFFNNELKLPLRAQGNEGQQSFAIFSQLAAYASSSLYENAKIVILISPSWFTGNGDNGTKIPKFLEFMYPGMMNKLYFESSASNEYKMAINHYVQKNLSLLKEPNFIYQYDFNEIENDYFDNGIKKILINSFEQKEIHSSLIAYENPMLDFEPLYSDAKNRSLSSSHNNAFGIHDEYFTQFIEPSIKKGDFPFTLIVPENLENNQEYHDFSLLLEFSKNFKTKPLFIIQDLHPYVFSKNKESMNKTMLAIKNRLQEYDYPYLDMWSYKKEDYEIGTLTDIVHMGELGWIKINQKIIDYFILSRKDFK